MASTSDQFYLPKGHLIQANWNHQVWKLKATHKHNKQGYEYLTYCDLEEWTSRQTKAVYQLASGEDSTHWYKLQHKTETGRPYLGRKFPEADDYNVSWNPEEETNSDKEPTQDKGKDKAATEYKLDSTNHQPIKEHHSTNDELKNDLQYDTAVIRNSPIGVWPALSSQIMSTTAVQTATITVQPASFNTFVTGASSTTTNVEDCIKQALNKALQRNPVSGPGGGGGGPPGGAPASAGGQPANQNMVQPVADTWVMGSLPAVFNGERDKADTFIDGILGYLCLNSDIPGFTSLMKKISLTLTLMQGEKVTGWVHDMGEFLDTLEPATDNVPLLWDQFIAEFREQFQDTQAADRPVQN